ncbi:aromatic amino acid aminotransferase [Terasakiispira papahanaumokuakeensis]|uniref:Aminotransferase n=1 Tax=Terasakiispira papahanaumokuakeensis TaxID=197479 RepID=A0A1E2VAW5_9GAMM|nr:amino acid aminotransferase [Terasakiispira papahanaumokuakeensis]ODC04063.1 aromatic amino acid aminotransferase [Terasakiispira papahanaumokuakeensis]
MFKHVPPYAGDPILSLVESYKQDPREQKVNLSIGVYYDEQGLVPIPAALREVQQAFKPSTEGELYLPMEGYAPYRKAVQHLIFGADSPALADERIATIQSLGGSGALMIGADFLKHYFPQSEVWVSTPTWENHIAIFQGAGFKTHAYPYFDPETGGVDLEAMLNSLKQLPAQSIVLLHPCCHNPTGADLTPAQWDQVLDVIEAGELIAFMDMAYQGLGDSMEADTYAIRALTARGYPFLLSNSFSKVFSLYAERVGALSIICSNAETAERVLGQLKATVRRNYSSPAKHGARLVSEVLNDARLNAQWQTEVAEMRQRLVSMREQLVSALSSALPDQDFSYMTQQKGMFSYTGLSPAQVVRLRDEHGVYLIDSGRMCVAGLNQRNIETVAQAIAKVSA